MPDRSGNGTPDRLADGVGEADEADVVGEGRDNFLTVVGGALAVDGSGKYPEARRARNSAMVAVPAQAKSGPSGSMIRRWITARRWPRRDS